MLSILLTLHEEADRDKLRRLYDSYHKAMLRLARAKLKRGGNDNATYDAEDVVQNAWCRIVKHASEIDLSREERVTKSYLLTIVSNECARFMSQRRVDEPLEQDVETEDFVERIEVRERYRAVVDAIKRLDDKYSNALYLHYVMEKSVKEVADLLGVPEKTVYTRLERGKKKLLEILGKEGKA